MRIINRRKSLATAAGLLAGLGCLATAGTAQNAGGWQIGTFRIDNYQSLRLQNRPQTVTANLSGPNLAMTSKQYDMAAPRIQVTLRETGKPPRMNLSTATANGGVRLEVRAPEAQQTTTVTCNSAVFTASAKPPAVGRVDLKGNVRSVTRGPAFAEPLVNVAESGVIEILGPGQVDVLLRNGNLSVTPREPAPQAKPKR